MASLLEQKNTALIKDVNFRLRVNGEKQKMARDILLISTAGLSNKEEKVLLDLYLELTKDCISFPMKERGKHLIVRIENDLYNFGRFIFNIFPQFRTRKIAIPRTKTLEVNLKLQDLERKHLMLYLQNIKKNRAATIGSFEMNGHQFTMGKLDNNRPLKGGHNCSSWIGTAPIGEKEEPLIEVLGGGRNLEVATNPGWWTNWLVATVAQERIPFVIYWSPEPLSKIKEKVISGKNLDWDFNRH